jgi:hypothetical protein
MRAALFVRFRQSSPSIRAKRAVPPHFQEEVSRPEAAVAEVDATPEEKLELAATQVYYHGKRLPSLQRVLYEADLFYEAGLQVPGW